MDMSHVSLRSGYTELVERLNRFPQGAPPNLRDGVVHHTRAEAEKDNEHFDGKTKE
jgi:hypothetical protein